MAENQQIQDPSEIGTGGLKGLKSIETLEQEGLVRPTPVISSREDYIKAASSSLERAVPQEVGFVGINDSYLDKDITSITQLDDLANTRGELQPWYLQVGAGLAKGAVLAGTTFADGILGTIVGLGNAAATGTFSGFWDNPFSNAMQQVNEWSEKALPNYYTEAELNDPWYTNIFTSNFLGDKFLKNLGFTVGAFYSGMVGSGAMSKVLGLNKARQAFKGAVTASGTPLDPNQALRAYREGSLILDGVKITEELARDARRLKTATPILKLTGGISGAIGEARIEAINNSKDWYDLHKQQLDDTRAGIEANEREILLRDFPELSTVQVDPEGNIIETLTPEGEALLQDRVKAIFDYDAGIGKLNLDRAKMGNVDFLLNIPLLTVSDIWQFGKLYAGGFNTARKAGNVLKNVAEDGTISYAASKPSRFRNALKIMGKGIAEGPVEEMGQSTVSKMAGYKYASELNDFYGAKIDPDAEEETIDWLQSMGKAILDTYGDPNGWEEGFIGALTGWLGVPGFRSTRTKEGGLQSPVYLQGGIKEDISEIRKQNEQDDAIVSQLNSRIQSPTFLNYYQSAIRHNKYQRDMDEAADNNDNFEFKNAEHNQLINDVIMFEKAGRINDLYDTIEAAGNVSPEDIEQIKQLTTNQETGISVYDNMTDEEIISQIKKQADETKAAVDKYRKISNDLQIKLGDSFSEDGLEEMTYYMSNIDNLEGRFKTLHQDIKDKLQAVLNASIDKEFKSSREEDKVFRLSEFLTMSPVNLINNMADSEEAQAFISSIEKVITNDPNKQDIISQVNDLAKIATKRAKFIDTYAGYLMNPDKLEDKQRKQREQVLKEEEKRSEAETRAAVEEATNINEFREAINKEEDVKKREKLLDTLIEEDNALAKDYKDLSQYYSSVFKAVNNADADPTVKEGALVLLYSQLTNSSNLQDIANPNSEYISNPETLYDESLSDDENLTRFSASQYLLLQAMNQVNNDNAFKSRFPSEYLVSYNKSTTTTVTTPEVTGASETSVVDPINIGEIRVEEEPVADITPEEVKKENELINSEVVTTTSFDNKQKGRRQYYRPAIPELHIEASKEGDFRPFNVIAAERNDKVNFDGIYNYLRDNGAFSYVNEGKLKPGDELGFMIDPEFNDHTIFIVDRRNNQIVGSIDESEYSIDRYEGLAGLIEIVKREFDNTSKEDKFIATPTTRVSQIMIGKIPYGTTEQNMQDIPGVTGESVFGIIKNGSLSTGGRIDDSLIIKPVDMSRKEGRMYILIPNAAGKYSPAAVRIKHFNEKEFDPKDVVVNSTPLYKRIDEAISAIARSANKEDLNTAREDLGRSIYIGDVHIAFVSRAGGDSIQFSKILRDSNGVKRTETVEGKTFPVMDTKSVVLNQKSEEGVLWEIGADDTISEASSNTQPRNFDTIKQEILNVLLSFNLPLQVNLGMLNKGGYNSMLLNSGVLTSNITSAEVKSSWFTTDYFDIRGNLQYSQSPASVKSEEGRKVETPVGGSEGAIQGTPVSMGKQTYYVDLSSGTVRDNNNRTLTEYPRNLVDLAYIQYNFGSAQNSATMVNGVALLPDGRVIDRNTGAYIEGSKAEELKRRLENRRISVTDSKKVIDTIAENQSKVDKGRTDSDYYYILEDDGQYHPYDRVHSRIGSNWVESPKQTETLKNIDLKLIDNIGNVNSFNNYLDSLSKTYSTDLSAYKGKTDVRSRNTIVNIIRDSMNKTKSQRALEAGSAVDSVVRAFFTSNEMPVRPSNVTEEAFNNLIDSLTELKSNIELRGETFITNNVVVFQKYSDGSRVAGELDILSVDSDGNFKIYDIKTGRYSFYDFVDRFGHKVNYFTNKSATQVMSQKDYYTKQLSAYKNLFESQYHTPISTLAILPFVLEYNKENNVSKVTREKGIKLTYDPGVNVPLAGYVQKPPIRSEVKKRPSSVLSKKVITPSDLGFGDRNDKYKRLGEVKSTESVTTDKGVKVSVIYYEKGTVKKVEKGSSYIEQAYDENNKPVGEPAFDVPVGTNPLSEFVKSDSKGLYMSDEDILNAFKKYEVDAPLQIQETSPIFEPSLEIQPYINNLLPEYSLEDSRPGFYLMDNKLHSGYLSYVGDIEGVNVWMTKVPIMSDDYGKGTPHPALNDFYAVFENGVTFKLIKNALLSYSEKEAKEQIKKLLSGNPNRMKSLASEDTIIMNVSHEPVEIDTPVTPATINQSVGGAAGTIAKEQAISVVDDEFEDEFVLRKVDSDSRPVWDSKKELEWIKRVLPQLSDNERLKVTKGLIKVGRTGALAWGQFSDGIITLSDIAAEGTTYHEAFHAVFQLLTSPEEREALLEEARSSYGDLSNIELEERMAEGFREYVMSKDHQNLGSKILNFFKELIAKITNWKALKPSLIQYYRNINEGYYNSSNYTVPSLYEGVKDSVEDFSNLNTEVREALENKGWTAEQWSRISDSEKRQAIRCIS